MTTLVGSIQLAGKTAAQWAAANPVLEDRQPAIEKDTRKIKIGDGVTAYNSLPYANVTPEQLTSVLTNYISDFELALILADYVDFTTLEADYATQLYVTDGLATKQDTIPTGPPDHFYSSDRSWQPFAVSALATVLSGLSALTGNLLSSDTVFTAFRKIRNFMDSVVAATVGEMTTGTDNVKYITPKGLKDYAQEWATTDSDIIAAITGATYDPANNNIATITPANSKVFKYSQIYVGGGNLYYALADNMVLLVGKKNVLKQYTVVTAATSANISFAHGLPDITANTPFIPSFPVGNPAIVSYTIDTTNIYITHAASIANGTTVKYNVSISLI